MKIPATLILFFVTAAAPVFGGETRVLVPIFLPVIPGAFGSSFTTAFSVHGRSSTLLHGAAKECQTNECEVVLDVALEPQQQVDSISFEPRGNPGRVLFIDDAAVIDFGLRVRDTRSFSAGTEIPVVPERDFFTSPFSLVGLPAIPTRVSRTSLRIYSWVDTRAIVRVWQSNSPTDSLLFEQEVILQGAGAIASAEDDGRHYNPAVAELFNFMPQTIGPARIEIVPTDQPIWALASLTDNLSQEITILTPSRTGHH